jgi:hypothetical protein
MDWNAIERNIIQGVELRMELTERFALIEKMRSHTRICRYYISVFISIKNTFYV